MRLQKQVNLSSKLHQVELVLLANLVRAHLDTFTVNCVHHEKSKLVRAHQYFHNILILNANIQNIDILCSPTESPVAPPLVEPG